jgi:hypothetical protein
MALDAAMGRPNVINPWHNLDDFGVAGPDVGSDPSEIAPNAVPFRLIRYRFLPSSDEIDHAK